MTSAAPVAIHAAAADEKTNNATAKGGGKQKQQSDADAAATAATFNGAAFAAPRRELRRLREGDAFILDINAGDRQCLMHARASSTIRVGHATVPMRPLLNAPFGACFELDAKSKALVRCDPAKPALDDDEGEEEDDDDDGGDGEEEEEGSGAAAAAAAAAALEGGDDAAEANELRNNSALQDGRAAAQRLQHDAIEELRASGAKGAEIVAALVAGSATFATKTALSQQKWVRRKVRKHIVRVRIRRPSAAALAAHAARGRGGTSSNGGSSSHTGGNAAIGCLRPEGVALLLNLGGVGPGARVLVVDGVGGLLAASVAERLGGHGLAVAAYGGRGGGGSGGGSGTEQQQQQRQRQQQRGGGSGNKRGRSGGSAPSSSTSGGGFFCSPPQLDSLRHVDVPQAARDAVVTAPLASLLEAAAAARAKKGGEGEEGREEEETEREVEGEEAEQKGKKRPAPAEIKDPAGHERAAARKAASAERQRLARAAAARGFDAFVCAAPQLDPSALLLRVAPLLAPSAPFAMHVAWLQPAAELASAAMEGASGGAKGKRAAEGHRRAGNGDDDDDDDDDDDGKEEEAAGAVAPFAAAAVHLVEPWIRRYQVLPRRTHPEMWASGTGGYLVHGVSLPEGGAASCGGERAAAAAAAAAAEKKAAASDAANGGGAAAAAAASSAAAAGAEKKKKSVVAASANEEYDPELSD